MRADRQEVEHNGGPRLVPVLSQDGTESEPKPEEVKLLSLVERYTTADPVLGSQVLGKAYKKVRKYLPNLPVKGTADIGQWDTLVDTFFTSERQKAASETPDPNVKGLRENLINEVRDFLDTADGQIVVKVVTEMYIAEGIEATDATQSFRTNFLRLSLLHCSRYNR